MKKVLIVYALEAEKGDIRIPGCSLRFCCTGIGKVSTAIRLYEALLIEKPDLVLNVGTAGTLNQKVGDILVCSRFFDRDLVKISDFGVNSRLEFTEELQAAGLLRAYFIEHTVSTGDTFQTDYEENGTHGDVFDMEAYAGAQVCKVFEVPYASVKYVTDVIGQNSLKHWEEKLHDAREGLVEFLSKFSVSTRTHTERR